MAPPCRAELKHGYFFVSVGLTCLIADVATVFLGGGLPYYVYGGVYDEALQVLWM